jgi:glycosyltransferase involved in cell wall biosynthesis
MRILHYLQAIRLEDGGVVRAVLDMCTYQARAGHEVVLATCDGKDVPAAWRGGAGMPRVALLGKPPRSPWPANGFQSKVDPLVRGAEVVHLHVVWDPLQLAFAAAARRHGVPYVQSPHGMFADWCMAQKRLKKQAYLALAGRRLIRGARFVVLAGEGELEQAAKRHPETPSVVLPLIFDTEPYRERPDPAAARERYRLPAPDAASILFLSRLHYQKRPDLILTAARLLRDRGLKFNLVFAGPSAADYEERLRAYARQLKLDDISSFLGMVSREKPSLYAACDLFVMTSTEESFGLVYFEALASGTPVLTTRAAATWRELESTGGARIVGKIASDVPYGQVGGGDVRELAAAMGEMIADRGALRRMGEAGRRWVMANLDPGVVVGRYAEMYRSAAAKAGRA